jgi:hypothetical protein
MAKNPLPKVASAPVHESVKEMLMRTVGMCPKDAVGWLYVARGLYRSREYHHAVEAVANCLRK